MSTESLTHGCVTWPCLAIKNEPILPAMRVLPQLWKVDSSALSTPRHSVWDTTLHAIDLLRVVKIKRGLSPDILGNSFQAYHTHPSPHIGNPAKMPKLRRMFLERRSSLNIRMTNHVDDATFIFLSVWLLLCQSTFSSCSSTNLYG